jgi:hypothetical protein
MRIWHKMLQAGVASFVLFALASGAPAQKVSRDYDHNANFSDYKTYTWIRPAHLTDQLMAQRVMDAVNAQLSAKGWTMVQDNADVGITANGATQEEHTLDSWYTGFPGWRWRWAGGGEVTTTEETYTVGTLVVDMFDTKNKQVIWRGTATDTLSDKPDKNAEKINKAVEKLFKDFPPK